MLFRSRPTLPPPLVEVRIQIKPFGCSVLAADNLMRQTGPALLDYLRGLLQAHPERRSEPVPYNEPITVWPLDANGVEQMRSVAKARICHAAASVSTCRARRQASRCGCSCHRTVASFQYQFLPAWSASRPAATALKSGRCLFSRARRSDNSFRKLPVSWSTPHFSRRLMKYELRFLREELEVPAKRRCCPTVARWTSRTLALPDSGDPLEPKAPTDNGGPSAQY